MGDYCIKKGYVPRPSAATRDDARDALYWNRERIRSSDFYQYGVYRYARELARRQHAPRVVDVGCGTARKLNKLILPVATDIVGIDQESAIAYCRRTHEQGRYVSMDLEKPVLPEDLTSADLAICSDVLEHLQDPSPVLRMVGGLVRENCGAAIFSTPDRDRLHGVRCDRATNPEHVREWNELEFLAFLRSEGFTIVRHFHQTPLRLCFQSARMWLHVLRSQSRKRLPFRFNLVVECRRPRNDRAMQ